MHQLLLAKAKEDPSLVWPRGQVRFMRSSSSSLAPTVLRELEAVFAAPVAEAYSMTEASHMMTTNPLPPGERIPGTVGLPAGVELAVLDSSDKPVAPGAVGEVCVRGENVTLGYRNNPEANASAFSSGWFHTGDQVRGADPAVGS